MEGPRPNPPTWSGELPRASIIDYLREAGSALDLLSIRATMDGSDEALRLAEASQCVHRALIVLSPL